MKNIFLEIKKCSSQILANGVKLVEILFLEVAPQNVIAIDDVEGS